MGRSGASTEAAQAAVAALHAAGINVLVAKTDVPQQDQVADLLTKVGHSMLPVRGIIHAAMVLDDALVHELTVDRMRGVIVPKVAGTWNLHALTQDLPLDFFVLYS